MKSTCYTEGDLLILDGKLVMYDGVETLKQSITHEIKTNQSEWMLNENYGVNYKGDEGVFTANKLNRDKVLENEIKIILDKRNEIKSRTVEISHDNANRITRAIIHITLNTDEEFQLNLEL